MFKGVKVKMREFRAADAEVMQQLVNDLEVTQYLCFYRPIQSIEESRAFVERQLTRKGWPDESLWVITLAEDPREEYIGSVGLHHIDWLNRNAELGIAIFRKDLLGQGLGREAIAYTLDQAFRTYNLHRVYLRYLASNTRARRCYEKCGFREEGVLREHRFHDGRYWDIVYMGISREEYQQRLNAR